MSVVKQKSPLIGIIVLCTINMLNLVEHEKSCITSRACSPVLDVFIHCPALCIRIVGASARMRVLMLFCLSHCWYM